MSLVGSFNKLILKPKSFFTVLLVGFFYFSFSVLILNYRLVLASLIDKNPLSYKFTIIYQLIIGSYSAFSLVDFYALILISILVGLNVLVTAKIIKGLREEEGKFSIVFGGSTVLGVLATGCSSCGFSVISLLGLTSALSIIPLGQSGLTIVVISLLALSLLYSVRTYHKKIVCKIK